MISVCNPKHINYFENDKFLSVQIERAATVVRIQVYPANDIITAVLLYGGEMENRLGYQYGLRKTCCNTVSLCPA